MFWMSGHKLTFFPFNSKCLFFESVDDHSNGNRSSSAVYFPVVLFIMLSQSGSIVTFESRKAS